jgi:hypothetical protein
MSLQFPARAEGSNSLLTPAERTRMIRALVDELIPGADGWPSASDAGVHGIVALRVFSEWSEADITALAELLGWQNGGLSNAEAEARIAAVKAFEAADRDFFDEIYTAVTLAYYETPFVIEAIGKTGRPYSHRPHVTGYAMAPFDPARDVPNHGRGHYLTTGDVRPVDTSALDLDTTKTDQWGLQR